jgi:hypothetical protein
LRLLLSAGGTGHDGDGILATDAAIESIALQDIAIQKKSHKTPLMSARIEDQFPEARETVLEGLDTFSDRIFLDFDSSLAPRGYAIARRYLDDGQPHSPLIDFGSNPGGGRTAGEKFSQLSAFA